MPVLPVRQDGSVGTTPLETFPATNQSGSAPWLVNVPAGTTVRLGVQDGTGATSYSSPIVVQPGQSDSWYAHAFPLLASDGVCEPYGVGFFCVLFGFRIRIRVCFRLRFRLGDHEREHYGFALEYGWYDERFDDS
ncbi:hypothetical protein JCM8202v2_002647 [Rhodotorula sphaerocarpa]